MSVRIRAAQSARDVIFVVKTLLEAGRDASSDTSPFGLAALMDSERFQQRQLSSTAAKVKKTQQEQRLPPVARSHSCLFILEELQGSVTTVVGSVGVMRASSSSHEEVACYPGVKACTQLGELTSFYIAKSHRGRGLGRRMLLHAQVWAASRGYTHLVLYVWRSLRAARALYSRHGWVTRMQSYSPADPEEDDVMVCSLLDQPIQQGACRCLLSGCDTTELEHGSMWTTEQATVAIQAAIDDETRFNVKELDTTELALALAMALEIKESDAERNPTSEPETETETESDLLPTSTTSPHQQQLTPQDTSSPSSTSHASAPEQLSIGPRGLWLLRAALALLLVAARLGRWRRWLWRADGAG